MNIVYCDMYQLFKIYNFRTLCDIYWKINFQVYDTFVLFTFSLKKIWRFIIVAYFFHIQIKTLLIHLFTIEYSPMQTLKLQTSNIRHFASFHT